MPRTKGTYVIQKFKDNAWTDCRQAECVADGLKTIRGIAQEGRFRVVRVGAEVKVTLRPETKVVLEALSIEPPDAR